MTGMRSSSAVMVVPLRVVDVIDAIAGVVPVHLVVHGNKSKAFHCHYLCRIAWDLYRDTHL